MKVVATAFWLLSLGLGADAFGQPASSEPAKAEPAESVAQPASVQSSCEGQLHGHVVDGTNHTPVAGAEVLLNDEIVAFSDEQGQFHLRNLCPGDADVDVGRSDYQPAHRSLTMPRSASLEIELWPRGDVVFIEGHATPPDLRSTASVDKDTLDRNAGQSFSDSLSGVAGVSQLRSASGLSKPIVRGLFGRRLLLLVDGLRHRSQDWGLDHAPEVDPFIASEIAVIRGAAGVRYGPDAIGGAIVVKSPDLLTEPGRQGEVHWIGNLDRGITLSGRYQEALAEVKGLAYQLEGSVTRLAAPSTPDYPLDNTGSREWSVGAKSEYRTSKGDYQLTLRHYDAKLGVCSCQRLESAEDFFDQLERERPADADKYSAELAIGRAFQRVSHSQAQAHAHWKLPRLGNLSFDYGLQHDHRREYEVVRTAVGPQFDFLLTTNDLSLAFEHAAIHLSDHLHLRGEVGSVAMHQINSYQGFSLIPDYQALSGGVYALERLRGHDFEVEAGLRYDRLDRTASLLRSDFLRLVRSEQLAMDACGGVTDDVVDCDSRFHTLSATLGGLYQFSKSFVLKSSLGSASRPPNPDEQYLNGTAPSFPVLGLGKPDLDAETTYSGSITASYSSIKVAGEVSLFANYISDYIYFAPALNEMGDPIFDVIIRGSFPRFVTRPVDALFYGADGSLAVDITPSLELGGQISMVRARNTEDDSFLSFIPADRARAHLVYRWQDLAERQVLYVRAIGTYVAKQDRVDPRADLAPPPDAYFLLDAEAGVETYIGANRYRFGLSGTNLTNQRYRDYTSLLRYFTDQPGWQAMLRLSAYFAAG